MECAEVVHALAAYPRDGDVSLALRRHVGRCEDCRIELTRYEDLLRDLSRVESSTVEPPPGLKAALVAIPSDPGTLTAMRHHVARNRTRYIGGAAVAAAGAVATALWVRRRDPATV